jgi:hypothetical protein
MQFGSDLTTGNELLINQASVVRPNLNIDVSLRLGKRDAKPKRDA